MKKAAINPTTATSDAIGALWAFQAPDSESESDAEVEVDVESAAGWKFLSVFHNEALCA